MSRHQNTRRGNVLLLTLLLMIGMLAMLALALDAGYVYVARSQMQRSADAAAIAAAWELVDENSLLGLSGTMQMKQNARNKAAQFAALNEILMSAPSLSSEDVEFGYIANPADPAQPFQQALGVSPNAVKVRLRRTQNQNGIIPLSFAPVIGWDFIETEVEAIAAMSSNIGGFQIPADRSNVSLLPFALDLETWNNLQAGIGDDNWTWDEENGQVLAGADGILEINLYPQGTGSPGNRGTLDIGGANNATSDIERQILYGVTPDDLNYHGGKIEFDSNGELDLNGDTGISAGVKDELTFVAGAPKVIPIFKRVVNPGNNATYTIVAFLGVRVLHVDLNGSMSRKEVIIQPSNIIAKGAIPRDGTGSSWHVYSSAWLVR